MALRMMEGGKMAALLLAGSSLTALWSPAALAQAPAPQAEERNEILVTAQRRAERLEDVPMSIAALPAEALQRQGVFDFDNLTSVTTGVRISRTGVFTQPAIRGVSTPVVGPGQENNVATYVDGFYQPDQLTLSGDLVGIQNVQILKGPQGTLYGRNATGGAILIDTLDPSDELTGFVKGTYARYNDYRGQAYASVPLTDKIAFNVLGSYRHSDGYIRDVTGVYPGTGSPAPTNPPYRNSKKNSMIDDWGVRAKLRFELSPEFTATLAYRHRFFEDNRTGSFFMTDYAAIPNDPGVGFGQGAYDYVSQSVPNVNKINLDEVSAKLEFTTGIGKLTSYTAYTDQDVLFNADYDGLKLDIVQSGAKFPRQTFQQALDYNITAIDGLDLVVGAHYYKDKSAGGSDVVLGDPMAGTTGVQVVGTANVLKTDAYAVFADGTFSLTDQLFVTIGGRYAHERKKFTSRYYCCGPATGLELFPGERRATFKNFSPRGVLRYEIGPRTNVYASVSRGFKSGTFNSVGSTVASVGGPPARPETITAYEVGFKTAGGIFRIDAAGYYYDYKNLQLTRLIVGPTGVETVLENAATAEIYGLELSVDASPTDALNLGVAVNYNHARYKNFPAGASAAIVGGFLTDTTQDFSGKRPPRAPDWTINASADYTIPVSNGSLNLSGNAFYSSEYTPTTPAFDPATGKALFNQPGYMQVNLAATWRSEGDRFEVGAFVNNVFNERYRLWYNYSALGAWYVLSEPTVWGIRAGVNF